MLKKNACLHKCVSQNIKKEEQYYFYKAICGKK